MTSWDVFVSMPKQTDSLFQIYDVGRCLVNVMMETMLLIRTRIAKETAHAVMKFMLYITTKDLDISGKKVDNIPQIASFLVYKAISKHYKVVEYDHQARKESGTIMSFSDAIFLNDAILELCRGGFEPSI